MESKSIALPLGYNPVIKGGIWDSNSCMPVPQTGVLTSFTNTATKTRIIYLFITVWKVLKSYPCPTLNGREWIRTTEPEGADLQSAAFSQTSLPFHKWRGTESNCRHMELQSIALPTELPSHYTVLTGLEPVISCVTGRRDNQLHHRTNCGRRIWTYDLRVMSPTSYQTAPSRDKFKLRRMWDLNPRTLLHAWRFSRPFP